MKLCKKCGQIKPESEFYPRRTPTQAGGLRPSCKTCSKAAARIWESAHPERNRRIRNEEKQRSWLASRLGAFRLLGGHCARCGFADHRAFQIHHQNRDGREDWRHPRRFYRDIVAGRRPVDDLELLCANCHSIEHTAEIV